METLAFSDLIIDKTKDGTKLPTNDYQKIGSTAIIDQGQEFIAGYTDRSEGIFTDVPVIIFGDHTRVFKYIDFPFFLGADGVKILKANREVNYRYLYYYFLQAKFPNTGYARHFKWLKELQIPLPPLAEQKHITAILDKTQKIIAEHKQMLQKYDTLIKSRFIEMFGDPVTNPKKWKTEGITEVCENIYGGGTPSKSKPEYYDGDIPWISPKDMKSLFIKDSQDHISQIAVENSSAKIIPSNSILMVIRSGILKHTLPVALNQVEVTVNQDMKAFIPNKKINPVFLLFYFKGIEKDVLSGVRAVTADNIDFNHFKQRKIILPPITLQNDFATFVQQIDKSKFAVQKSLEKTETLYKSLMQQYFG